MFDQILGIPAHPLLVHAAVIFIPLQILAGFAYALVPATRRHITWAVLSLAVLGPVTAFVAKESGEALEERLVRGGLTDLADVEEHSDFADMAFWFTLGLSVLMVVLVLLARGRRGAPVAATDADADAAGAVAAPAGAGPRVLLLVVSVLVIAVGAVTGYYIFKTGDTGAHMVWSGM